MLKEKTKREKQDRINLYIPKELKSAWGSYCKSKGYGISEGIVELIKIEIGGDENR